MPGTGPEPGPATLLTLIPQARLAAAVDVWDSALCAQVDPEIFFPEVGQPCADARAVCEACPVRALCLDVFGDLPHGFVGGLSVEERRERRTAAKTGAAA
jgi:WhiB family redox-sensing transcriptional regulator